VVSYTAFLGAPPRGCDQAVVESVIAFPRCVDTHAATSVLDDDRIGSFGLRCVPIGFSLV
jgi:hypothetical protein